MTWHKFSHRLPTQADADEQGRVLARDGKDQQRRAVDWDWIPPHRPDAAEIWRTNGFVEWRGLKGQPYTGGQG